MSQSTCSIKNEELSVQITEEKQLRDEKPFSWNTKSTKLLINLYSDLKEEFRDPKTKKKQLWSNIKDDFLKHGYITDEEALDRKWRNLKKTFTNIKDNIRRTGKERIYWEHYDAFNNIYSDDSTVNPPKVFSSSVSSPTKTKEVSHNVAMNKADLAENITSSSSGNSSKSARRPPKSGAYYLRKRLADIEERRVEEVKMLRLAIERGNKIQEERTALLKEFLDKAINK